VNFAPVQVEVGHPSTNGSGAGRPKAFEMEEQVTGVPVGNQGGYGQAQGGHVHNGQPIGSQMQQSEGSE